MFTLCLFFRVLQSIYSSYNESSYNSSEIIGASLFEALDRYKKYMRKLNDTVRPNEDVLKKLSTQPNYPNPSTQTHNLRSSFSIFPNGGNLEKAHNATKKNM